MLPELLSKVHEDTPRRWHQDTGVGTPGAPNKIPGHLAVKISTMISHVVEQGAALSATSARELILAILTKLETAAQPQQCLH
eukprot:2871073-Amphidinium_carterae.1